MRIIGRDKKCGCPIDLNQHACPLGLQTDLVRPRKVQLLLQAHLGSVGTVRCGDTVENAPEGHDLAIKESDMSLRAGRGSGGAVDIKAGLIGEG